MTIPGFCRHRRSIGYGKILTALDAAENLDGLNRPSFRLHPLKGQLKGIWAATVRANWRVIFRFADGKAYDLDFVDYH